MRAVLINGFAEGERELSDRKPNVVLINCDDLGYGDLGCYGSAANKSPYVDKLALSGVRFTSFYAASPVCCLRARRL